MPTGAYRGKLGIADSRLAEATVFRAESSHFRAVGGMKSVIFPRALIQPNRLDICAMCWIACAEGTGRCDAIE
jgi:hypothetical protein